MTRLSVTIPGEPQPKQRPRVTAHGTYTALATALAEERIGWAIRQAYPGLEEDATGLYRVRLTFWTRRTNTDVDNLQKTFLDAANGIVWCDDRQVVDLHGRVVRDRKEPEPRTELLIERLEEWP